MQETRLVDVVDQVHRDRQGLIEYHYVIVDYLVTVKPGEPHAASDALDLKWVSIDEVDDLDLTPSFRRFFVKNKEKIREASIHFTL